MGFKDFYKDQRQINESKHNLFEFILYKNIEGTNCSYREDSSHGSPGSQKHAHVYARRNGNGKELYSVNKDGTGHDGSKGPIPKSHADYFRQKGYSINKNNILETLEINAILADYTFFVLIEAFDNNESGVISLNEVAK